MAEKEVKIAILGEAGVGKSGIKQLQICMHLHGHSDYHLLAADDVYF